MLGIDNRGLIYLSLLQANSNASTMRVFLHALIKKLEARDKYWYHNTILMCDNASYHNCASTLQVFEELGMPVLFTGPHSYSASPAELVFAAFKRVDINPRKFPTGKK